MTFSRFSAMISTSNLYLGGNMNARRMIEELKSKPFVVKKITLRVDYNERRGTGELFHRDIDVRGNDSMDIAEVLEDVVALVISNSEVIDPKFTLLVEGVKEFCLEVNEAIPEHNVVSTSRLRVVK